MSDASNDAVREHLLKYLYDVHGKAKSPRSAGKKIREIQAALKEQYGHKQQLVASNLDYLIQKGWVREIEIERKFTTPRGTQQSSPQSFFKISDTGIDAIEGASPYKRTTTSEVNITNVQGVTVVGDGNVVNTSFTGLHNALQELKTRVEASTSLTNTQKLDLLSDVDSLQGQLQKPAPNRTIVSTLWAAIEKVVMLSDFADLVMKIGPLIAPLLLT